jgi:hypothetical protein
MEMAGNIIIIIIITRFVTHVNKVNFLASSQHERGREGGITGGAIMIVAALVTTEA